MFSNLGKVLDRSLDAGLKLKPRKCHLFAKKLEYILFQQKGYHQTLKT